jgi:hypothetical protein
MPKRNELGKRDSWATRKLWRRIWATAILKNKLLNEKTEIRIKPSFGIFSKIDILRFGCRDSKFKCENGISNVLQL